MRDPSNVSDRPTPVIVYLSGHLRGKTRRLWGERLSIGTASSADIPVAPHELPPGAADELPGGELAALVLRGQTYELECAPGARIWINGERLERKVLASGDLVEIGEGGPVLRFRLYEPGSQPYKSVSEVYSDCRDCARHGGRGLLQRARILLTGAPVELATQTSPRFRINLVVALALVLTMMAALTWRNVRLESDLIAEREMIEGLSDMLERAESSSFSADDLAEARVGLEDRLSDTLARVEALESLAGSRERVISAAARSVVFLQGGYGFVEGSSGKPLRFTGSPEEKPDSAVAPVSVNGTGPVVEILYTGTGFLASSDGLLLTNRHVALPWEYDPTAQLVIEEGFQPTMRRFRAYFADEERAFDVELLRTSDEADLALLRCAIGEREMVPLELNSEPPRPGEEVIVLGYPTGMNALLARTDPAFAEALLSAGPVDFWVLAERLAAGGHIAPLATVGVVGQVNLVSVVYDAETTHGGSGGPVLDLDGKVVAVNAAVVPDFTGSNLGVPAARAAKLMEPPATQPEGPAPE
jgi:S1-C subfamily serine protease